MAIRAHKVYLRSDEQMPTCDSQLHIALRRPCTHLNKLSSRVSLHLWHYCSRKDLQFIAPKTRASFPNGKNISTISIAVWKLLTYFIRGPQIYFQKSGSARTGVLSSRTNTSKNFQVEVSFLDELNLSQERRNRSQRLGILYSFITST